MQRPRRFHQLDDCDRIQFGLQHFEQAAAVRLQQQRTLLIRIGIAEPDSQQESIELRVRQRVGADHVQRVLGCNDEER